MKFIVASRRVPGLNEGMGKYFFMVAFAALLTLSWAADHFWGRGSSDIIFQSLFGILFFTLAMPVLVFILLPVLKSLLGPASATLASEARLALWLALAELYTVDGPSDDEVEGIARELRRLGVNRKTAKVALETEVGPVCEGRLFRAGDYVNEGVDRWQEEWLRRKILEGARAYKFLRAVPIIGWYFSWFVTGGRRKSIALLLSELPAEPSTSL